VSWGFHTLWTKRAAKNVDPAMLNFIQFACAAAVLSVASLASEPVALWQPTASLALGIAYLAVAGTVVAWLLWVRVLKEVPASTASAYIFTVPLIGLALSWLLLDEPMTLQFVLGVGLVSAGIVIVNRASALSHKPAGVKAVNAPSMVAPILIRAMASPCRWRREVMQGVNADLGAKP